MKQKQMKPNPFGVRLLRLPACRMVTSGMDTGVPFAPGGKLEGFNAWFSQIDTSGQFMPRDFLWHDAEAQGMEWWYVHDEGMDTGGFDVVDFEGGLYAAAISWDGDGGDGECVYAAIREWVHDSGCFALDERPRHRCMFHVITPPAAQGAMGRNQLDIFVPVKWRELQP